MKPSIWIEPGLLIFCGSTVDAEPHQHGAVQLILPFSQSQFVTQNGLEKGPLLVNSNIEHQLSMGRGMVVLIEPQCNLGERLIQQLDGQPVKPLATQYVLESSQIEQGLGADAVLALVLAAVGLQALADQVSTERGVAFHHDQRIQTLLVKLNDCFNGDCQKDSSLRAVDIASGLSLSESRFLHLFKQEMGMPWRPYLLWRRLICASNAMLKGAPATYAAQLAGFSDSAHLSRTFRSTFGMSIRQAVALLK